MNKEALSALAPLFKAQEDPSPILLLGAGASFRSGVPTANEAVRHIARLVYSERELRGQRPPERVKPTEWESWLRAFPWFLSGEGRLAENFPVVVEQLLKPAEFRKRVLLDLIRPRNGLSPGYHVLADFVMRGLVRTVLTTNFDTCLLDALKQRYPQIRHVHEVNRSVGDYDQFNVWHRCQVLWLHGRAEHYSDKNAAGETGSLDPKLVALMRPLLGAPIVVIGYRGAEQSIMQGVFGQSKEGRLDFPQGVYWCVREGETPHANILALEKRLGSNFQFVRIEGFDELLEGLAVELAAEDRYTRALRQPDAPIGVSLSFDERVIEQASIDDLDLDLALSVLRQYCEKLGRAPVTHETLFALMREQGLLVANEQLDSVTAGAVLLFGKRTQEFFPHAVVSVTEAGKKRQIYDGNLVGQYRRLLEKLDAEEVNPRVKVKGRRVHEERRVYPPRVLVELIINTLVHRDYECAEAASVDINPQTDITFANPGGLTHKMAARVSLDVDGRFVLSESMADQRNPSLCDIFFGMSAMERAGTGLIDVAKLMAEWGGTSAFYHRSKGERFEARVSRPVASGGSRTVARSGVPTGLYVLNVLPFAAVPETVSVVQLKNRLSERPAGLDVSQCGTFISRGAELWSFVPLKTLLEQLGEFADHRTSTLLTRQEVEYVSDSKRILSWLLRKHWERHVSEFEVDGLILEDGKKHRAYFQGRDGQPRTIVWDSPQRRANKREVVKRRAEGNGSWFENEGFGYEVVEIGGLWCVRIKPFYMFTNRNARTPLPAFARASKATSRIKFDRNKNVETDLVFWSSFLAKGCETINIGGLHVNDLLLDAAFLTVEVPEVGLSDDTEHQNRLSA
jgi:hypothetical protein